MECATTTKKEAETERKNAIPVSYVAGNNDKIRLFERLNVVALYRVIFTSRVRRVKISEFSLFAEEMTKKKKKKGSTAKN